MRRSPARGMIRPKVSTMPRQQSEAAAVLDIYKLVIEKKRLQHELQALDQRREQICQRLGLLDQHVVKLEGTIDYVRDHDVANEPNIQKPGIPSISRTENFETFFLEY